MLKKYKSLEKAILQANFNPRDIIMANNHIMGKHTTNGKIYICHINFKDEYYVIDNCKVYDNLESASLVMIGMISKI